MKKNWKLIEPVPTFFFVLYHSQQLKKNVWVLKQSFYQILNCAGNQEGLLSGICSKSDHLEWKNVLFRIALSLEKQTFTDSQLKLLEFQNVWCFLKAGSS